MTDKAAQLKPEYRFMEFLNWLDAALKERLEYVFLALVFGALALFVWWMLHRKTPVNPDPENADAPVTGAFFFCWNPNPAARGENIPPLDSVPSETRVHSNGD